MRLLLPALVLLGAAASLSATRGTAVSEHAITSETLPATLSEYGFFVSDAAHPSADLIPYKLNTPLFSDYSEKQRFIYLPSSGTVAAEQGDGRLIFPTGTAIVKSFGYPGAGGGLKIIETRVLLHRNTGWVALPYVWRADGSDADLKLGGAREPVRFTTPGGEAKSISYAVPNKNQCKQCHASSGNIVPIGPRLGNMAFPSAGDEKRLLSRITLPQTSILK
jgi:hypothetical protein